MGIRYNEKDYAGQRYGMLVALYYTGEKQVFPSGKAKRIWLLRCDCGREVTRTTQSLCNWARLSLDKRAQAHCGCKLEHGSESIAYEIWSAEYSDGDISFEQFLELSQQNCYHCGSEVKDSGRNKIRRESLRVGGKRVSKNRPIGASFIYHGLDRINNEIGHVLDNVVPCCWPCNNLRGARELTQFLEHITKIITNYTNRNIIQ